MDGSSADPGPAAPAPPAADGALDRLVGMLRAAPWVVEVALVLVCAVFSVALTVALPAGVVDTGPWWWVDLLGGLLSSVSLVAARRSLVPTTAFVLILSCVATTTGPATSVLQFLVGLRRGTGATVTLVVLNVLAGLLIHSYRIDNGAVEMFRTALVSTALWAMLAASGAALRIRGLLLTSLRAQAVTAQRRAEEQERTRIAREMHDVVAHRIALLAMQAGALNRSSRLTEGGLRRGIDEIASTARAALEDLHDVLRVLRRPDDGPGDDPAAVPDGPSGTPQRPQPLLTDLPDLIETMRDAGAVIESRIDLAAASDVPATPGRTIYRVAQEALANATKHAPGAIVDVTLSEPRPRVLHLVVTNDVYVGPGTRAAGPAAAGSGSGLIGLRERVELAGGTIWRCGIDPDATPPTFRVEVTVPWTR